jgi:hypothetical protein
LKNFAPNRLQSKGENPPRPLSGVLGVLRALKSSYELSPATQEKYGSAQALFNRDRENDLNNYFNKRLYPATFYNCSS